RAPRRARDSGSRWGWRRGARDRRRTCRRRSSARRPKWPLPCSCWQYSDAVMNESVSIPVWLAIPAALLAAWAAYDKLVVPALRWMVTRPANQVIDELSTRLRIGIRPFQRTRRQALIHRLTTDPDATVVFVMNHRSNMDYVLAGYLAADQTALSYAVGEWARLWPLSALIRAMGAYFVRRNSADELYRRVLERYVAMATEAGVPAAVFPEGGLTRDGLIRAPKLGVIDYMIRGLRTAGARVSMRAYCRGRGVDFQRLSGEERRRGTAALGEHLMRSVGRVVPVVPVPLMATVFVRNPARRLAALELKAEVERLIERLDRSAARVYVPRRDLDYALDVGLRMLLMRHLVEENEGTYVARERELPLLRYYANSIAHLLE